VLVLINCSSETIIISGNVEGNIVLGSVTILDTDSPSVEAFACIESTHCANLKMTPCELKHVALR
jgi:hypothetical protein